jgi:hypothetical protein
MNEHALYKNKASNAGRPAFMYHPYDVDRDSDDKLVRATPGTTKWS